MKLFIYITAIFIILLTFSNCKKDSEMLTIKGKITNSSGGTTDPTIILYGKKVESGTYNASFQKLKTATIDISGNFTIEIEKENISEYKLSISKYKYFTIEDVFYSSNFSNNIFTRNYTINPSADINIVVKNTNPYNENDYFKYKITNGYIDAIGSCSQTSEFQGTSVDEEYNCKVIGSQEVVFEWTKAKNNITTTGTKTVYCNIDSDNFIEFYY